MPRNRHVVPWWLLAAMAAFVLAAGPFGSVAGIGSAKAATVPERCSGYGTLQSISLTHWEAGLGAWTAGTHDVANPGSFDTPDWAAVGNLPDLRPGKAAFVANLVSGSCGLDDKSGALRLDSPPIPIPAGTEVPRISFDHWFQTEFGWDGGNFKISVNGGGFNLIPSTAIETVPYEDTLFDRLDELGFVFNSNPLAEQDAFTGTYRGKTTGYWVQSRINLLGIASAGDTVRLRFDFGIDVCTSEQVPPPIGWYVDDVEFYGCEAELPPGDCGNRNLETGEQCDDGNSFIGDGCSNVCQVEDGWQCTDPTPPGTVPDSSFEAGRNNPFWDEVSNNPLGSPICDTGACGSGGGSGPSDGSYWAWFGGIPGYLQGSLSQDVTIIPTATELTFDLEIPVCDSPSDYVRVLVDGNEELRIDGSSPLCGLVGYTRQSVDISAYADGLVHNLEFQSETFSANGGVSNFFVDVVEMPRGASMCQPLNTTLTLVKQVINDDGGSAQAADWNLIATGPSGFSGAGPIVPSSYGFLAGTYSLSEGGGPAGYSASSWACVGGTQLDGNTISLAENQSAICTISNDDIAPTLTVLKDIVNDSGGSLADPDAFGLEIDGFATLHGVSAKIDFGDHAVSENGRSDYVAGTWVGDCDSNGAISLVLDQDATCTITNNDIAPTLRVFNTVINDNGGTVTDPNAFGLMVDGARVLHNVPTVLYAGAHTVSKAGLAGYAAGSWSGNCAPNGTITLVPGQNATCTITHNDIQPGLTLRKQVINDNGGTATPANWTLTATGPAGFSGSGNGVSNGSNFQAGTYDLSQSAGPAGYSSGAWVCVGGNQTDGDTVTLAAGQSATCTVTSNDIAPTLKIVKTVINDNAGTVTDPNAFGLRIDGQPVLHNIPTAVNAGSHTASEVGLPGYVPTSWGGDCNANGSITLALGQDATCSISNDDLAPGLTLVKQVTNNNGGTAVPAAWTLTASGPTGFSGAGPSVSSGANFVAGSYDLSESGPAGYSSGAWVCVGGIQNDADTVTLASGESATCTLKSNDIAPALTLVKDVTNDHGGTAVPADWIVAASGPTGFVGSGPSVSSGAGFVAGSYDLSESGPAGYSASAWVCVGVTQDDADTVTLAVGESAVCTLTNNDIEPSLTLVKAVTNDNGGTAIPANWTLTATGPAGFSGAGPSVPNGANFQAGTYDLSENGGPAGYTASNWVCGGGSQIDADTVTLKPGDNATCTITNNDIAPTLKIVKTVVNDNAGTVTDPNAFGLRIDGQPVLHNVATAVNAGNHTVSEVGLPGYAAGSWSGDCNPDGSITLALDQDATCALTNDDIEPALTLVSQVTNNNGGTAVPGDWTLTASGPTGFSGAGPSVSNGAGFDAGSYDLSANGPAGYSAGDWVCIGGTQPDGDTITLVTGESATCTIGNDDIAPTLKVLKFIVNDNGGTVADPNAFGLKVDGALVLQDAPIALNAGNHTVSELGRSGYIAGVWGGHCTPEGAITLVPGQNATCGITNNDAQPGLSLVKQVINDDGGTAIPEQWTLTATGPTGFSGFGPIVSNGTSFDAGTYDLSESVGPAGYTSSAWVCIGGTQEDADTITLALGELATCTITSDDDPPAPEPALTLVKAVTNDNGGTAVASEWILTATGPTGFSGAGPIVSNSGAFQAGTYDLSESGPNGYSASDWICVGGTQDDADTITLAADEAATCTLYNNDLAPALTLVKAVTNNNGGTAMPADWILTASGPTGFMGTGPSVSNGASFDAGTYNLSESGPAGYTNSDWVCVGGAQNDADTVTVGPGETATCTISGNDIEPGLTLVKEVTNDNGGTAVQSNWTLTATGPAGFSGIGPSVANDSNFQAGTYDLSENGPTGYTAGDWSCVGGSQVDDDTITLEPGQFATCTVNNNDIAPTLMLVKAVTNNNGGTAAPNMWTLTATGPSGFSGVGPSVSSEPDFLAGSYDLSEFGPAGYSSGAWVCSGVTQDDADTVTLGPGQTATCTISSNDSAPTLTLIKQVTTNDGGSAAPVDWLLTASGPSSLSGPGPSIMSGPTFKAGTYNLSESTGPGGYAASTWDCVGGIQQDADTIKLALGVSASCTITNDDIAPTLTVVNTVTNDNGGTVTDPNAFGLKVDGARVLHNVPTTLTAGIHTVSAVGVPGYVADIWGGDCNPDRTITLVPGQNATCTITHNDIQPGLTLVKQVINDNGGTATPANWTLTATGPAGFSGSGNGVSNGPNFQAGTYDLSQSAGPAGYSSGAWVCVGGNQTDGDTVTLAAGQAATCTVTSNDIAPTLKIVKTVINDNAGTVTDPNAFGLRIDGQPVLHNIATAVNAGSHTVSEVGLPGYVPTSWGGACNANGSITLALGQDATCTISNDDLAPGLTLVKQVTNNNGGTAVPAAWTLTATGPTGFSGAGPSVSSGANFVAGSYDLSESGPAGYSAGAWVCVGGIQNDADTVTLVSGESATCTLKSNDIAPALTLVKDVTNDHGGTAVPADWIVAASGPTGFVGSGPSVSSGAGFVAGSYDLSESGPAGYSASAWVCVGVTQDDADTVTLAVGESAVCTLTNDDIEPSLTLVKAITNDNGGTAIPANWTLTATGSASFSGAGPSVPNGANFQAGTYDLSESGGPAGYSSGAWVCVGGSQIDADTVTLKPGDNATCTISNNDIAPTLTLVNEVVNNNGGTALASAWILSASGPSGFSGRSPAALVSGGFVAGSYDLSASGPAGYSAGDWVCIGGSQPDGDTVTLGLGQSATCTLTHDDDEPSLTLVKQVTNDDGGTAVPANWTLTAAGPTGFSGAGPSVSNNPNFRAGTYDLSESGGPAGYTASAWSCVGGKQVDADTVKIAAGESVTCMIDNDDIAASLTLLKEVINDNGGTAVASDWTLTASGPTGFSGSGAGVTSGADFDAGTYDLSEAGPAGYSASSWDCVGGTQNDADTITLAPGQAATCTITNDDLRPGLTLVKIVSNFNGGTAEASDWTLNATGPTGFSGAGPTVMSPDTFAAGTYDLFESDGPTGYSASEWDCVGGTQDDADTVTLAPGDSVTCTITNDDDAPSLTLVKAVTNDNGGSAAASNWTLTASGPTGFSGSGAGVSSDASFDAGTYDLSESGPSGYAASAWVCTGVVQDDADTITLGLGQSATCTITNDDVAPTLTLVKHLPNDDGGTAIPSQFQAYIDGSPVDWNTPIMLDAGQHVASEDTLPGYQPSAWFNACAANGVVNLNPGDALTCEITNDDIAPSLTLVKAVTKDNGGTAIPADWTLTATGPTGFSGSGAGVSSGAGFDAGTYNLSEIGPAGYAPSAWVCEGVTQDDADTITLGLAQSATCTITNDDIAPTLKIVKTIVNDNGGTVADPNAFGLRIDGALVSDNTAIEVTAGSHTVSEDGLPGYAAGSWGGDCNPDGSITLALNQDAVCTITNDDIAPSLTLVKAVTKDNGGTAVPANWTLTATGPTGFSGSGAGVSSGAGFDAGTYNLSEIGPAGYSASAWVCEGVTQDDADTITLGLGQSATCTITNDDIAPTLKIVKTIVNDNGGSVTDENAFGLRIDGAPVLHNAVTAVTAGSHTVSEDGLPGYAAGSWGGDCNPDGSITLALDQDAVCTITNDDLAPSLTLVKAVTKDNGGTAVPANWTLTAAGPTGFSGSGAGVSSGAGFDAGTYNLSEIGPAGYAPSAWVCSGVSQDDADTITLGLGQSATCTITNDDIAPSLTLIKAVTNNNGGTAVPADWTLTATGPTGFSGSGAGVSNGPNFQAGTYTLSESAGPAGYTPGTWSCAGGTQTGVDTISLAPGQAATCTITNDDLGPGLTLLKTLTNDNGGTAVPADWTLTATGPTGFSGPGPSVSNGDNFVAGTYTLSESDGPAGYDDGNWVCVGGAQDGNTIELAPGEAATCTISNNDLAPSLTLVKAVTKDDGGTAVPADWTLTASGPTGFSGSGAGVSSDASFDAGTYYLSESGPAGYAASAWVCEGIAQDDADTVTLSLGQSASCTITNDDVSPTLKIVKTIVNDNGGGVTDENAFGLRIDGAPVLHSIVNPISAGNHTVSEDGLPGYTAGSWGGDCNPDGSITLVPGQNATCTITNNDAAPSLTLLKAVTNDNGGTAIPGDWTLTATGPTSFSGSGAGVSSGAGFDAGIYNLSEIGPAGYAPSAWVCTGVTQDDADTITLGLGQSATCTITNDDISPTLKIVKTIVNDNGGSVTDENAFGLRIDGAPVLHNAVTAVSAGSHTVSEDGLPGYMAGSWGGDCNPDGTITLALGQNAVCTVTNDDTEPGLTLVKEVVNDSGGLAVPAAWTLTATGPTGFSGPGPNVSSGSGFAAGSYDLSESGGPAWYTASDWVCVGGSQQDADTIFLAPGQSAICTITNDDVFREEGIFSSGFESE